MDLQEQINQLRQDFESLKSSSTIPYSVDQAFRERQKIVFFGSRTIDFGSIEEQDFSIQTVTCPGAAMGDVVLLGLPAASLTGIGMYMAWVSAADTVSIQFTNPKTATTGNLDPGSGVFTVAVIKQQ